MRKTLKWFRWQESKLAGTCTCWKKAKNKTDKSSKHIPWCWSLQLKKYTRKISRILVSWRFFAIHDLILFLIFLQIQHLSLLRQLLGKKWFERYNATENISFSSQKVTQQVFENQIITLFFSKRAKNTFLPRLSKFSSKKLKRKTKSFI